MNKGGNTWKDRDLINLIYTACTANYQQEAGAARGGGIGYTPANPYDDQSSNATSMSNRGCYSTQLYG